MLNEWRTGDSSRCLIVPEYTPPKERSLATARRRSRQPRTPSVRCPQRNRHARDLQRGGRAAPNMNVDILGLARACLAADDVR